MAFFDELVHGGEEAVVDVFDGVAELLSKGSVCLAQRDYFVLSVRNDLVHAMGAQWFLIVYAIQSHYVVVLQTPLRCFA